jgi:hypothetical protein
MKRYLPAVVIISLLVAGSTYLWKNYINPPPQQEYAYTKGVQAVIHTFPYVFNSYLRWSFSRPTNEVNNPNLPSDSINKYWHARKLIDPSGKDGVNPNTDTLYSLAWVYIDKEPLIFSVPDIGMLPGSDKPRYYNIQFAGFNSDNFGYVGTRTTGNSAGQYAVVPPGWDGQLPDGVIKQAVAPSAWIIVVVRIVQTGISDLDQVRQLQDGFKITALSQWGQSNPATPYAPAIGPIPDIKSSPLSILDHYWRIANAALTENLIKRDTPASIAYFQDIEVGPGKDVARLSEERQKGMSQAILAGLNIIRSIPDSSYGRTLVNGWSYLSTDIGRAGNHGDFLLRAGLQSFWGLIAHEPIEATYLMASQDLNQQPLDGSNHYQIHFSKDQLPKTGAFWSISLYDDEGNLSANRIGRYSIGDRTEGIYYAEDGSLSIDIGHSPPQKDQFNNWLPAPEGKFGLILRAYLPHQDIIEQNWEPPNITKVP